MPTALSRLKRIVKDHLPDAILRRLPRPSVLREELRIRRSPDRLLLKHSLLPRVRDSAKEILWVGCRDYTREYPRLLEASGARCWTLEIEADQARFGHPIRHVIGDLLKLDSYFKPGQFDAILCNGIFGYGVDSVEAQRHAMLQMAKCLRPGGVLVLGWNDGINSDPSAIVPKSLKPVDVFGLGQRLPAAGTTHVYDFFRAEPLAQ